MPQSHWEFIHGEYVGALYFNLGDDILVTSFDRSRISKIPNQKILKEGNKNNPSNTIAK